MENSEIPSANQPIDLRFLDDLGGALFMIEPNANDEVLLSKLLDATVLLAVRLARQCPDHEEEALQAVIRCFEVNALRFFEIHSPEARESMLFTDYGKLLSLSEAELTYQIFHILRKESKEGKFGAETEEDLDLVYESFYDGSSLSELNNMCSELLQESSFINFLRELKELHAVGLVRAASNELLQRTVAQQEGKL